MKPLTRRWLKRTIATIGASAITLIGIVLTVISLQHHLGSEFLETRHTNFYSVLLSVAVTITGIFLLVRFNVEPGSSEVRFPNVRVNVLCLMGAILGFFCMLELGWASGSYTVVGPHPITIQVDWTFWPSIDEFAPGEAYSWFFVLGTVFVFITPTAGFLQLGGLAVFAFRQISKATANEPSRPSVGPLAFRLNSLADV